LPTERVPSPQRSLSGDSGDETSGYLPISSERWSAVEKRGRRSQVRPARYGDGEEERARFGGGGIAGKRRCAEVWVDLAAKQGVGRKAQKKPLFGAERGKIMPILGCFERIVGQKGGGKGEAARAA